MAAGEQVLKSQTAQHPTEGECWAQFWRVFAKLSYERWLKQQAGQQPANEERTPAA